MRTVVRAVAALGALVLALAVPVPAIGATDDGLRPGQVVTIAGSGERGFSGDGGDARDARLESSLSIDVGPDGTVYIADAINNRVRAVTPGGTIDTLMEVDLPLAVSVDDDGTVYIAARYNVVRIDPDGSSTVIGGPDPDDFWDGDDVGDGGLATEARMHPFDLAIGPDGTGYVADANNRQIRAIDTAGVITTVAGGGERGLDDAQGGPATDARLTPAHLAADSHGTLYFTEEGGHTVWRVGGDGSLTALAGDREPGFSGDGGPAAQARFGERLGGLHVDGDDVLYVADSRNGHVRRIGADGFITTVGPWFDALTDVAVGPDGHLYVVDGYRVMLVAQGAEPAWDPVPLAPDPWADEQPGTVITVAGTGEPREEDDDASLASQLDHWADLEPLRSVAVGPDGNLYYAVSTIHRVLEISPDGTAEVVVGTGERGFSGDGGPASDATLASPSGISVGPDGTLYIADRGNGRIRAVDTAGTIRTVAGTQAPDFDRDYDEGKLGDGTPATEAEFGKPADVAVGGDGRLYIADTGARRIRVVDPDGIIDTLAGGGDRWAAEADDALATEANLWHPETVAVDPDGNVYFIEHGRPYVRMVDTSGMLRTVAGDSRDRGSFGEAGYAGDGGPATAASLNNPRGLAVAPDGTLHIADTYNGRVRTVDADGQITTVAGTGDRRDTGDGGTATDAALNEPAALAFDADGNLYLDGSGGHLLRRVDTDGTISTLIDLTADGVETGVGAGIVATETALANPARLAVDRSGVLYIGELFTGRLHAVKPDGTIRTVADGHTGQGRAPWVAAIATAGDGSLYVARNSVHRLYPDGATVLVAGGGRGSLDDQPPEDGRRAATTVSLFAKGLAVGPGGDLYLTDRHRIYRLEPDGFLTALAEIDGVADGFTVGPDGSLHLAMHRVGGTDESAGPRTGDSDPAVEVVMHAASAIAVDSDGTVYLSTPGAIHRLDPDGTATVVYEPPARPAALALDAHGNLYFADQFSHRVQVLVRPADIPSPSEAGSLVVPVLLAAGTGALLLAAAGFVVYRRRLMAPPAGPSISTDD